MHMRKVVSTGRKKRATTDDISTEPRKRRARYALRACCECKRRKVRCDGHMPCEHCQSRSIQCLYDTDPKLLSNCACDASHHRNDCSESESGNTGDISEIGRLNRLVENMQAQINMLIELNMPPNLAYENSKASTSSSCSIRSRSESTFDNDSVKHSPPRYCGATSSDYTLNVVRFSIRSAGPQSGSSCSRRKTAHSSRDPTLYSPTSNYERVGESSERCLDKRACFCLECTRCLRKLDKTQAIQLIDVYQEAIGYLHPVLDVEHQKSQIGLIYTILESGAETKNKQFEIEQDSLDIVKIVLSIALLAQSTGQSDAALELYNSVKIRIQDVIAHPAKDIRSVLLALLASIYHFFHDEMQLAWRMGGIAGRMAMELGLHHRDTRQRAEDDSRNHGSITNILWSIVILDRLWSCTIGLPPNFQDADFARSLAEPAEAPYLKAMVSYASFTPRLWDHNSRLLTADAMEDENLFDVTNFQIDQWKERFLAGLSFVHPNDRVADIRPQSLPTLLYLRANLLRGLVVTSYFLSCSRLAGEKQMAQSGVEIARDTIAILSDLDATTDIYHKQHPFFQHFLASSVALLFLVIMHESGAKEYCEISIGEKFNLTNLSESISRAFRLAELYSETSSASERLWKRMKNMGETLSKLGISYTGDYSKLDGKSRLKKLENDHPRCKLLAQAFSPGPSNGTTDEARYDNSTVRPCSLNMNDQIGALDDSHTEGFFGLADETLSADCGTDAYLVDITGFESDIDNQTWWDLSAIFSQGF